MSLRYDLHRSPGYLLTLAARQVERRFEEGLATLGLTRLGWTVLLAAGAWGHDSPSEIARFIGVDRTAVSRALRGLEKAGLVQRGPASPPGAGDEAPDRRRRRVALTALGEARVSAANELAEKSRARIMARLGAAETEALVHLLTRLVEPEVPLSRL